MDSFKDIKVIFGLLNLSVPINIVSLLYDFCFVFICFPFLIVQMIFVIFLFLFIGYG